MTQVQDMTDQQLNRGLAELMGYTVIKTEYGQYLLIRNGNIMSGLKFAEHEAWQAIDYCNDPAASLEVQEKAIEVDADYYVTKLTAIVEGEIFWSSDGKLDPICVSWLLTATPRQRAEAAYMTLFHIQGGSES